MQNIIQQLQKTACAQAGVSRQEEEENAGAEAQALNAKHRESGEAAVDTHILINTITNPYKTDGVLIVYRIHGLKEVWNHGGCCTTPK